MQKYLLDTDIISYAGDEDSPFYESVTSRLENLAQDDQIFISDLSIYEYKAGLYLMHQEMRQRLSTAFDEIVRMIEILPLSPYHGGEIFGNIRNKYKQATGISDNALKRHTVDMILASEAVCHGMVLVYNDQIYEKIAEIYPELKISKWT